MNNPSDSPWGIAGQLRVLLDYGLSRTGEVVIIDTLLAHVDISRQGLHNLLNGTSLSPRLTTLRSLCDFYQISLDYFECPSEIECLCYLAEQGRLISQECSLLIHLSHTLPPARQRSMVTLVKMLNAVQNSAQD